MREVFKNCLLLFGLGCLLSAGAQAAQFSRPDLTLSVGGYLDDADGTALFQAIDEISAVDSDYIWSDTQNSVTHIRLSGVTDPNTDSGHIMRIRAWPDRANQNARLELFENSGNTLIATFNFTMPTRRAWQDLSYTLSAGEAASISDYTDLSIRFTNTQGGDREHRISWMELEVPEVVVAVPTVTTPTFTGITASTATLGGNVTDDGGAALTSRGTVWDTSPGPTTQNSLAEGGTTTGVFSHLRSGLDTGTQIFFNAYAVNSAGTGRSADGSFYTEPASSPASASISSITSDSFQVSWPTNPAGDGDGALVVVREASAVTATPTDGTEHAASATFGSGADLGTQQYVVFRGAGTSVTVTGLTDDTTYHVAVYYYAGTGTGVSGINYRQASPAVNNATTDPAASLPVLDQSSFDTVGSSTANMGGNITSDGGSALTARGTVWNTTGAPITQNAQAEGGTATGSFTDARSGLNTGTQIFFRSYAINGGGTGYGPDNSFYTEPASSAVSASINSITSDSFQVSWPTNPAGDGDGALVVVREASAVTATPTDGTEHAASAVFGSGADLGTQQYVVFRGAGTSVTVTGLTDDTTYHVAVYYYAGTGTGVSGINYRQASPAVNNATTDSAASLPVLDQSNFDTVGASTANMGGNITSDGGSALTARGTVWNTTGAPITQNAQAEGGTATGSFTDARSGLNTGTQIFFRPYATNGSGTGYGPDNSFYTEPASSPASAGIDTVGSSSFRITWPSNPAGDGDGALVIVTEGLAITATPTDGTEHAASAVFGSGADLGTQQYVVFRGTGTSVTVSGLTPNTTYTTAVFYSAGSGAGASGINYRADSPAVNSQTTTTDSDEPTIQASNLQVQVVATRSIRFTWTAGNGDGSIATVRVQGTSEVPPVDFTDYTADRDFSLAPETSPGSGNYVVYKSNGSAVTVNSLTQNTTYTITVYAWGAFGAATDYLTVNPPETNQITDGPAMHNYDNVADCTDCHNNHGGTGGFIPRFTSQEDVCRTCHQNSGTASAKQDFALHLTPTYAADDVDCGSCHEVHRVRAGSSNTTESTNPVTSSTDHNLSFIRANVDKWVSTATPDDAVYHSWPNDLAIEDGTSTTARGICQSCHLDADNHRHDGSGDQCHDGSGGNCGPAHTDCFLCHTHVGNFLPSAGGCTGCHSSAQPTGSPMRREIVSEFARLSTHVADTSLVDDDCEVCHAQDANGHLHGPEVGSDKRVTLWDTDDHGNTFALGVYGDPFSSSSEAALLNPFCLSCHDSDGADAEGGDRLTPFTDSGTPPNINSTWSTSSHGDLASREVQTAPLVSCAGDGQFGCHASGHGSEKLTLLAPDGTAATPPDFSEQRETFCLNCHSSGGISNIDIDAQLNGLATNFQVTNGEDYTTVNQKHDILPADQAFSSAVLTCKDCHDPHEDNDARPVGNPDTGAALANYSPANSYSGDATSFSYDSGSGNDLDPTNPIGPTTGGPFTEPDYIEFCLTCHDGTAPPGVTLPPGASNLVNIAESYRLNDQHGRLVGNGSASRGYLKKPWATQAQYDAEDQPDPYAAMNCNLCHGPHGSDNIYNLRTSIVVAGEQMEVGGLDVYQNESGTTYTLPTNNGGDQEDLGWGAWCTFCHEQSHDTNDGLGCQRGHRHGGGNF